MQVHFFGQLTDITQRSAIEIATAPDTKTLLETLIQEFPALATVKFAIAVDKTIVQESTPLTDQSQVALLPPFSGG